MRRVGPRARGARRRSVPRRSVDDSRSSGRARLGERPAAAVRRRPGSTVERARRGSPAATPARAARRALRAVRRRAGRAARTGRPCRGAPASRPRWRRPPRRSSPRRRAPRGRAARDHAALADDLLGDLVHGGEHAADAARRRLVGHRAVGDGEVVSSTKPWRLISRTMSSIQVAGPPWNGVSISGPMMCQISDQHSRAGCPSAAGMLGAEDRAVGVVVDGDVLRPPPEQQREAVGEQEADHRAQRGRPGLDRADRRARPVERADQRAHLAAAGEPSGRRYHIGRCGIWTNSKGGAYRRRWWSVKPRTLGGLLHLTPQR